MRRAARREGQAGRATRVREKTELANADEAARQDVLHEATQKLHRRQRHRAPLIVMRVVLPLKRDPIAVEGQQPMIADGHAMGIAPEVSQHRGRPAEGRLGVDDPVRLEERVDEGVPLRRVRRCSVAPARSSSLPVVAARNAGDKFPAKDPTEDLHGEEEARYSRANPAPVIRREAAGRHDTVDVRMADQGLSPGVQDAQEADLGAEVPWISRDLAQRRRTRLEEPGVQAALSDRPAAAAHAGA